MILDRFGKTLVSVYLHGFGEPFLNPELPQMIQACTERNILSLVATNGNVLQDRVSALKIVDVGLKALVIAVDGSSQETYQVYRQNGEIEKVKRFISEIEEAKIIRHSPYPYSALRCIVTKDNQDEQGQLEKLARDLGVNMFASKSLGCLVHKEDFKNHEPTRSDMRRFAYKNGKRVHQKRILCPFPFRQPYFCWDGTLLGCGYDIHAETPFGSIGKWEKDNIWNSFQALRLRRSIWEGRGRPDFCSRCPYQDRIQDTSVLDSIELRPLLRQGEKNSGK
jgi:MoaA/NifB/PqqE/SkfB family radical SAM enzyme